MHTVRIFGRILGRFWNGNNHAGFDHLVGISKK